MFPVALVKFVFSVLPTHTVVRPDVLLYLNRLDHDSRTVEERFHIESVIVSS